MPADIASWAQVVASIAVLATLVYLSIQTKQTNIMMQAETRQNLLENDVRSLLDFKDASGLMQKLHRNEKLPYEDGFSQMVDDLLEDAAENHLLEELGTWDD